MRIIMHLKTHNCDLMRIVSDYMDSDTEDFVPTGLLLKREKFRARYKTFIEPKVSTRHNPQQDSIVDWFPGYRVECFAADAYRFNLNKQRWVRKGPVIVCLMRAEDGKHRMLAYYLHGTMSVAFNTTMFPFMGQYVRFDRSKCVFATGGRNGIMDADMEIEYSTIGQLCPASTGLPCENVPAMRCHARLKTVPESASSIWCLKFSETGGKRMT